MRNLKPRDVNKYFFLICAVGLLIGLCGAYGEDAPVWLGFAGIGIIVCGILFRVIFYRCPHCGRFLDRSTGDFCPYCGEKVNE